ncbi:uncharacterized protein TNCV_2348671 [Trichonephila clavipes]|uniref:Mutator-like transposase domain-containing protein n=1 Tax=Trichonephila clavipes TaxID=2585209 RepID=A0A8X6VF50_TRICX|nr:uncharacterized protein TNCV_2348671 [Trichonephila clavipes]
MNGCVAAISVDTGKVFDIEVMSSYCPTCKRLQTMPRNFEYESSKADYICQCNFTGSSSKMEIMGASRIFLRSEKNRRLHYTQYYGDGDSKAFMSVKDTYGLNSVTKFECIGHVQKRVEYTLFTKFRRLSSVQCHLLNYGISSISFYPTDTKGYPLYVPAWINPDQLMTAIENMSNATKSLETGIFTKLIADPKFAASAFVTLSVVAAAIVPVLMNYVLGNTAPVSVSTTANNRGFRNFDASKNLDDIMENIANLTRAMDNN